MNKGDVEKEINFKRNKREMFNNIKRNNLVDFYGVSDYKAKISLGQVKRKKYKEV